VNSKQLKDKSYNNELIIENMKKFTCVQDIGDLKSALAEAFEIKKDRFKYVELGRNKTLMMIFFNSSLRTRLSTQKAALNLGMNVMVLDINQGAWKLETERGVIMDGDKPEHLLEAIPVMGCYCDIIGVRSFARFENRDFDYQETILNQFIQYSGRPVFSMEAAIRPAVFRFLCHATWDRSRYATIIGLPLPRRTVI
jgi:N-succinyl-L-ornithine transcarbamylase